MTKRIIKPIRIIEDIDDISDLQNQSACEAYARNAFQTQIRSLKEIKISEASSMRNCMMDQLTKKKSNANPNEGKKSDSFDSLDSSNTVIENECDNDYSGLCTSLCRSRYHN